MCEEKHKDEYFNNHKESYAEEITAIQLVFYENTAKLINNTIKSSRKVLNIGNGGVINYSFNHLEKCIEISNVEFIKADILDHRKEGTLCLTHCSAVGLK